MHLQLSRKQILPIVGATLLLTCLIAQTASARKQSSHYSTYNNVRFEYSIDYPTSVLIPQPESTNGDGRRFASKDEAIDMRIWGQYNVLERSVKEECATEIKSITGNLKITYKRIGKDFYAFSGTKGNTIYYVYAIYRTDKFITMRLVYPSQAANRINPYIQHIVKSIKADKN